MYCEILAVAPQDVERALSGPDVSGRASTANRISLEKSWHGLHYLLTGNVWEGDGPLAFLLAGGEQLGDDEESPVRWFPPEETRDIHQALSSVSDDELWTRFDPAQMEEQQIYPGVWDEPESDLKEEYLMYFHQLKELVAAAVQNGHGLVVSIG